MRRSAVARHPVHPVVEQVVPLAGHLVDPVDVDRPDRMLLVDRQVVGPAVDLARAGVDDPDRRVVLAARLEDRQLRAAVDLEVGLRVGHRIEMARLPGQVEQEVLIAHESGHRMAVADIGDVDLHPVRDVPDVVTQAAVLGDQAVDDRDVAPDSTSRAARLEPMNPRPPVISTFRPANGALTLIRRASGSHPWWRCLSPLRDRSGKPAARARTRTRNRGRHRSP